MTIVPIGKINLQVKLHEKRADYLEEVEEELGRAVKEVIKSSLERLLEAELEHMLRRAHYRRRKKIARHETDHGKCNRCQSRNVQNYRRNGHRWRELDTKWGHMRIGVPQVECVCGGAVHVNWQLLKDRQRIWDDVEVDIRAEYGWGLSLRQIKMRYDGLLGGSLGLRTLNERILAMKPGAVAWPERTMPGKAPVIQVDGLWFTIMVATGETKKDAQGRMRAVKTGKRIPILVAQGIWPDTGRKEGLCWVIGEAEDQASWQELLYKLGTMGYRADDLRLLICDGSPGFEAARQTVFPWVPLQRCIFHKIRNFIHAIVVPPDLDRKAAREFRQPFIEQVCSIWQAEHEGQARKIHGALCQQWAKEQPKAVAVLQRDFDLTLTFYQVRRDAAERGLAWRPTFLRTTSHLERENRNFRTRLRKAVVFHSKDGLSAAIYQNLFLRTAARSPDTAALWRSLLERQIKPLSNFLT
jgi:transposase-like protein